LRKITKIRRSIRAISPVISVLLMIAIAVVASLVAYAWVMGYIGFQTAKTGQAVQIQSVAFNEDGSVAMVYVQNVGDGTVKIIDNQCLYIDGQLDVGAVVTPALTDGSLLAGKTAGIDVALTKTFAAGDIVVIKLVTEGGTYSQISKVVPESTTDGDPGDPGVDTFTVTFNMGGTGGDFIVPATGNHVYDAGDEVAISATALTNYHFVNWVATDSISIDHTDQASAIATIDGDGSITANFAADSPTTASLHITFAGTGSGKVNDGSEDHTATYDKQYTYGVTVTLTPTADAGSTFTSWSGAGSGSPIRTITMNGDQSATVTFTLKSTANLIQNAGFEADSTWSESSGSGGSADRYSSSNERSGSRCGHTSTQYPSGSNSYAILTQSLTSTPISSVVDTSGSLTVYLRRPNTASSGTDSVEVRIIAGSTTLSYIWCASGDVPSETTTQKYIRIGDVTDIPTSSYTSLARNLQADWNSKGLSTSLSITSIQLVSNGYRTGSWPNYHYYGQDIAWDDLQLLYYS
jgi:flagellin-like protein